MTEIEKLKSELIEAAQAYYHDGTSLMTDEEYDDKLAYLSELTSKEDLENDNELYELLVGSPSAGTAPGKNLVAHDNPMLSLAKAKNEEELESYHKRLIANGATGFTLQAKLDGLALSALYVDGKLTRLATRGDGTHGEDITYLINCKDLDIDYLPNTINHMGRVEVRGEIFARNSQFEVFSKNRFEALGEQFSNSRNAVSGILTKAKDGLGYHANITFIAYSAFENKEPIALSELINDDNAIMDVQTLTENEVDNVTAGLPSDELCYIGKSFDDMHDKVLEFGTLRPLFDIPTDGVVIKPLNEVELLDKMGYTSHHPLANIAYKYPGTKALAEVLDITLTVGKTGRITPQAKITPTEVDGVIISNITCHNFSWMHGMNIRVGSKVYVTRANDVIPAIASVVDSGDNQLMPVPTVCPECGGKLDNGGELLPKTLSCVNDECPSRLFFYMKSIVARPFLHIDGLGTVALEALCNIPTFLTIVDLFNLDEEVLAELPTGYTSIGNVRKLGAGNAKNIVASIENAKKNTPAHRLIASLGIPNIGPNTAKKLLSEFGSVEELLLATPSQLSRIEGMGETTVNSFVKHGPRAYELLQELIELGVVINMPAKQTEATQGSFSISGSVEGFANRTELVEYLESLGWEYHKSPKSNTDILFADPNGTSSKIKKAKKDGVKIVQTLSEAGIPNK